MTALRVKHSELKHILRHVPWHLEATCAQIRDAFKRRCSIIVFYVMRAFQAASHV